MTPINNSIEIRMRGRWIRIPSLDVNGKQLFARGKWLKTAMIRSEEMMENELENPELYIEKLKGDQGRALKADIFTFTQKLPAVQPKHAFPMEWESVAAIRVVSFNDWWEILPQETRKNVRRSQKRGVTVRIKDFDDELIEGIQGVNNDSPFRQGMRNAYYDKSFDETKKLYGEFCGRCDFICAYFGDELIGFLHLIYRGDVASILNLTTKQSHNDKRPANSLLARAVKICTEKGISYITYGYYNYGNKRNSPLREFKVRNGFSEIRVPRFFVPLTWWGKFCMKANLHRGWIGILPHSIISIAVSARSLWYKVLHFRAGVAQ